MSDSQLRLFDATTLECGQVERWAAAEGYGPLIGCDEAGRGPLAGPVVTAACVLSPSVAIEGLNDSKKLTEKRREALFDAIVEHAVALSVVIVERDLIDELNILHASLFGMAEACRDVVDRHPELAQGLVVVDGNKRLPLGEELTQRTIVKGDARSLAIAAASILAKVSRDRLMVDYHQKWPHYGFAGHKGYPTVAHREAIAVHGPCPLHRRSFKLPERLPSAARRPNAKAAEPSHETSQ